jgi:hypothetical protein
MPALALSLFPISLMSISPSYAVQELTILYALKGDDVAKRRNELVIDLVIFICLVPY